MHYSMFMAKPPASIEPAPDAPVEAANEPSFEVADCYSG